MLCCPDQIGNGCCRAKQINAYGACPTLLLASHTLNRWKKPVRIWALAQYATTFDAVLWKKTHRQGDGRQKGQRWEQGQGP